MNDEIRKVCREAGLRFWEVAEKLGILDSALSRMMRHELPEEKKQQILAAIEELAREKAQRWLDASGR